MIFIVYCFRDKEVFYVCFKICFSIYIKQNSLFFGGQSHEFCEDKNITVIGIQNMTLYSISLVLFLIVKPPSYPYQLAITIVFCPYSFFAFCQMSNK